MTCAFEIQYVSHRHNHSVIIGMAKLLLASCLTASLALFAGCSDYNDRSDSMVKAGKPNILLIVADDMGFSDLGIYGAEISTPNVDALAKQGVMFTEFHVAPNCGPTRGSLLTGLDFHRAGMGGNPEVISENQKGSPAYQGFLRDDVVTVSELLQEDGYRTFMAGKWHLGKNKRNLPGGRGFDRSFALLNGGASHWADQAAMIPGSMTRYTENDLQVEELPDDFYSTTFYTDLTIEFISDAAAKQQPFFAYLAYTAPHNPLHAPDEAIEKYRGRYTNGWDALAAERIERMRQLGLLNPSQHPHPRPDWLLAWKDLTPEQQINRARDMEIYAGMIDFMDQNIGRVLQHLKKTGQFDNTLIIFMSDNGPSKTTILDYISLGGEAKDFFESFNNSLSNRGRPGSSTDIGPGWAYAIAAPMRLSKGYVAQGGIRVPLIVKPIERRGSTRRLDTPVHITDLAPTFLELAEVRQPNKWHDIEVAAIQGRSLAPLFDGKVGSSWMDRGLGWSAYGMDAYRRGHWKVLRLPPPFGTGDWQLYNLSEDPGETRDIAALYPQRVAELSSAWEEYAKTNGVITPNKPVAYARPVSNGKY